MKLRFFCLSLVMVALVSGQTYRGGLVTPPLPKPRFVLTDTSGAPFDFWKRTQGSVTLLFFGYTHCPDMCPLQMSIIAQALKDIPTAATSLGRPIQMEHASTADEIDLVFAKLAQRKPGALLISNDPFFNSRIGQLSALTVRHGIPAIHSLREFAVGGGLVSYGPSFADGYRLAGGYVGRILKGDKPSDLPVMQSTKFELIVNLKAARTLGLKVPLPLLASADEVIE